MPNIATVLKEEILRLARKEIRNQTSILKKMSAQYRIDIAEMKRRMSDLQRKITPSRSKCSKVSRLSRPKLMANTCDSRPRACAHNVSVWACRPRITANSLASPARLSTVGSKRCPGPARHKWPGLRHFATWARERPESAGAIEGCGKKKVK